eukprot:4632287-Pyramimonas_sp.AAC.1
MLTPETSLLSALGPKSYSYSVNFWEILMIFLTLLELQISYRALRHRTGKNIRGALAKRI